jgi:hypothetical protein
MTVQPNAICFWCERLHHGKAPLSVCPVCAARHSILRALEMSGSHPLSDAAIDAELTQTSPGNYALGYMDAGAFRVFYVGRSDSDVKQRLHEWVDMPSRYEDYASPAKASWVVTRRGRLPVEVPALGRVGSGESSYTHFAYSYAGSSDEAYAKELRNYDAFVAGGLDNPTEPIPSPEVTA